MTAQKIPLFDKEQLWHFSFDFYAPERIKQLCLMLQDDFDININLVLFLLWYSEHCQRIVGAAHIEHLLDAIAEADSWVEEFRTHRRQLWQRIQRSSHKVNDDVRKALLDAELTLEAQVQSVIIDYANKNLPCDDLNNEQTNLIALDFVASENLDVYFHYLHPGNNPRLWNAQQTLIHHLLRRSSAKAA